MRNTNDPTRIPFKETPRETISSEHKHKPVTHGTRDQYDATHTK